MEKLIVAGNEAVYVAVINKFGGRERSCILLGVAVKACRDLATLVQKCEFCDLVVPKKSRMQVLVLAMGLGTRWLVSSRPWSRSNTFRYPSLPTATAISGS